MQGKAESLKTLTLECWQAEDDVIDALGTLAEWLGLVQQPFPAPSQYQSLLDCIRDDEALVKEIEGIYGSDSERLGRNDAFARVKGPALDCLSDASMETSAQSLRVLETSMKRIHHLLGDIQHVIGSMEADEVDGLRVDDVSMVDCLLENAPILDSLVIKVSTSLLSLTKSEMDGLVLAARMLHIIKIGNCPVFQRHLSKTDWYSSATKMYDENPRVVCCIPDGKKRPQGFLADISASLYRLGMTDEKNKIPQKANATKPQAIAFFSRIHHNEHHTESLQIERDVPSTCLSKEP